jgi:hypothetical protein
MSLRYRALVVILGAVMAVGLSAPALAQQQSAPAPTLFKDPMYAGANLDLARKYLESYNPWNRKDIFWQTLYRLPKQKLRYTLFSRQWPRYYLNVWDMERDPRYQPPEDANQDTYRTLSLHRMRELPYYDTAVRVTPIWDWEKKALAELEKRWALIQRGVVLLDNDTTGREQPYFYWDRPAPEPTVRPDDVSGTDAARDPTVPVPQVVRRLLNPNMATPITQGAFMPVIRQRLQQMNLDSEPAPGR